MVGRYGMVVKHDLEREMKMKQSVSSHGHKKFVHFLVTFVTLIGIVGGGGRSSSLPYISSDISEPGS